MSNPFGEWIDSVCDTFGWGDDEPAQQPSQGQAQAQVQAVQEAMEEANAKLHDALLESKKGQQQCTQPPDTSDDYKHPKSVDDLPSYEELAGRLGSAKMRIDAITRRVHGLQNANPSVGGRPTDPKLAALVGKQQALGSHYGQVKSGWSGWSDRGQRLALVPLEREVSALECEVVAYRPA